MNERQLKRLFLSSLESGHIRNNTVIPSANTAELRVIQEANFRSFDLVVAAIQAAQESSNAQGERLLARTKLLTHCAKHERCEADRIHFYPIELKSDDDNIDERLPNQIIDAILTFGHSIVVLDQNHSKRVKTSRLDRVLPASIICYCGEDDYFEVISVFDRFVSSGIFDFERFNLARLLQKTSGSTSAKAYRRFTSLQQVLQKIVFSQLHFENPGLTDEEQRFICSLAQIKVPSRRKMMSEIRREVRNEKLTDYL